MMWRKKLPNYLTYFRIVIIPALVVVFYGGNTGPGDQFYFLAGDWAYYLSTLLFFIAGVTDWLDGHFARAWNVQSSIGRFLDPIADKLLVVTALILLVSDARTDYLDGRAMVIPAIAIVCREVLVSGLREFLAEIRVSVPVSQLAKWKTGAQMLAIGFLLLGGGAANWYVGYMGNALLWIAALLTLVTGYAYLQTGLKHME